MRKHLLVYLSIVGIGLAIVLAIRAMTAPSKSASKTSAAALAALPPKLVASPGDKQIRVAENLIERAAENPKGYNLLASAFMQKARETGDFSLNSRAAAALNKSFEVAPDNYDGLKLKAKLLLTEHRFREALDVATKTRNLNPRDYDAYGALTDAYVELGQYPQAVEAAQAMVDLRPYTASYARVSYLRALHGESQGAIQAMRMAQSGANPADPEQVAWCAVQLGDELLNIKQLKEAEREFDRALFHFPNYYAALAAKARARIANNDLEGAIEFYTKAQERVPLPDVAIALGDVYAKSGRTDDAQKQYQLAEYIARTDASGETYARQIAVHWADHNMNLDEALSLARKERENRADIYSSDALAWCLYKKGEFEEARKFSNEALRLGTRDARLHYHAGMIAAKLGEREAAAKHLKLALDINPTFDLIQADNARATLKTL